MWVQCTVCTLAVACGIIISGTIIDLFCLLPKLNWIWYDLRSLGTTLAVT